MSHRSHFLWRGLFRTAAVLSLSMVATACSDPATETRAESAASVATTAEPSAAPADVDTREEDAAQLGRQLAAVFQSARARVSKGGGSARYWGNNLDRVEMAATIGANAQGFGDFQYMLDCSGPEPRPICAMVRAFEAAEIEAVTKQLRRLMPEGKVEIYFVGMADSVWKASRNPRTYRGECGAGDCVVESGTLHIDRGLPVDSNDSLACLRSLCTYHASGLAGVGKPTLRAEIVDRSGFYTQRRAEIELFVKFPADVKRPVWDSFLRAVGHK